MPTPISCPYCQQRINISKEHVERDVQCPYCNGVFFVSAQVRAIDSSDPDTSGAPEPPLSASGSQREMPSEVRNKVRRPAIGLIVTGSLTTLAGLLFVPALLFPDAIGQQAPVDTTEIVMSLVFMSVTLILGILTIYGGFKMLNLESYYLAMASAIAAMVPCYCCLLGLPIGIWAVVVLRDPDVKSIFTHRNSDQT